MNAVRPHSHITPRWAQSGKPRDASHPSMSRWKPLQPLLKTLGELFDVEIAVIDTDYFCVAGAGHYENGLGHSLPKDTVLGFSLRSGEGAMVLNPGRDEACIECSIKEGCRDQANYTGPVMFDGQVVAALQIVAVSHQQRNAMLKKAESTYRLIRQLIEQLYATGWIDGQSGSGLSSAADNDASPAGNGLLGEIIGESPPMRVLKEQILQTAQADSTVLIYGESGTGKELIARAVHNNSARREAPFVAVNCGAIPESLIESELFGYEGGAFSGARTQGRKGVLQQAHGGTIFFDEIADLPLNMQVKLLRALQEHEFLPVGGTKPVKVDVRVLAASNQNLGELVKRGVFRSDLYYRLNVIPLTAPPLRERREDIRILVAHFIEEFRPRVGKKINGVSAELIRRFEEYHWPGNVRELKNFVEYGVQFCREGMLTRELMAHRFEEPLEANVAPAAPPLPQRETYAPKELSLARRKTEREQVALALEKFGNSVQGKKEAAAHLNISIATLYRILKADRKD